MGSFDWDSGGQEQGLGRVGSGAPRVYEGLVVGFGASERARIGKGPLQSPPSLTGGKEPTGGTSLSRFGSSPARLQRTVDQARREFHGL